MISIILPFKHISTNQMYMICRNRLTLTKKGRDFKERVRDHCKMQYILPPIDTQIRVSISLIRKDKRRFDIDNIKALLDSLNGVIWVDDSLIVELYVIKRHGNDDEIIININPPTSD